MNWREHIHSDPAILTGKPVVRGTRISVELLLGRLAEGWSEDDLQRSYPHLPDGAVRATIAFAHDMISENADAARAAAA